MRNGITESADFDGVFPRDQEVYTQERGSTGYWALTRKSALPCRIDDHCDIDCADEDSCIIVMDDQPPTSQCIK